MSCCLMLEVKHIHLHVFENHHSDDDDDGRVGDGDE